MAVPPAAPPPPPPPPLPIGPPIGVGDSLPEGNLLFMAPPNGVLQSITISDLTIDREVLFIACPEAYMMMDLRAQMGFRAQMGNGVMIALVELETPLVTWGWPEILGIEDREVQLLFDEGGRFTRAIGINPDGADVSYTLFVFDGVVVVSQLG